MQTEILWKFLSINLLAAQQHSPLYNVILNISLLFPEILNEVFIKHNFKYITHNLVQSIVTILLNL